MEGFRNNQNRLWDVPLPTIPNTNKCIVPQKLNFIANKTQPIESLIKYLHAALFSPTKSTLLQAIHNNHFLGLLCLTEENVPKYLTETIDWSGLNYCGLTINWDYRNCKANISIPEYSKISKENFPQMINLFSTRSTPS